MKIQALKMPTGKVVLAVMDGKKELHREELDTVLAHLKKVKPTHNPLKDQHTDKVQK